LRREKSEAEKKSFAKKPACTARENGLLFGIYQKRLSVFNEILKR
jgi:hypothetical protein